MIDEARVLDYLGFDPEYTDTAQKNQIKYAIEASKAWLAGAVGSNVNFDDPRAEQLVLMAVGELYEIRNLTDSKTQKVLASLNRMAHDLILQLKWAAPYAATSEGDGE